MDYKHAVALVKLDPRYQKNIEYGKPRKGHPEGTVKQHIAELEANLNRLRARLPDEGTYWKLQFLIQVHDTFKAEAHAVKGSPHHGVLARNFASEFTDEVDVLNMIQYHDEGYGLWKQFNKKGAYDAERFQTLLTSIQDWDLFLTFMIIDGCTPGKDWDKTVWFINEIRRHKESQVDESWLEDLTQADT